MALLGNDGLGYELARKLESCGVWRLWLGESSYSSFAHFLSSPSLWESFMKADDCKTRAQIQLELRVRALLYDKATISLFLRSNFTSPSAVPSKLNPAYLQLHGDDLYFPFEDPQNGPEHQEGSVPTNSTLPKVMQTQSRIAFSPPKLNEHSFDRGSNFGSRYSGMEAETLSQRHRHDELPETWYNQYIKKYRISNKLPVGDGDSFKRTPEGMSNYLRLLEKHKRRRQPFNEDQYMGFSYSNWENGSHMHPNAVSHVNNSVEDETCFFPEMMFPSNCVPDSALPSPNVPEDSHKVEFYAVLDNLPPVTSQSAAMMERFGIKPEYLRMEAGRSKCRGKNGPEGNRKPLSQEQASKMTQKVIARVLTNIGLEGATEASMEVLSQFFNCHIGKLGGTLKVLSDNYRKQCSAIELLKMFLQTLGYGNLGVLADHIKDGTKVRGLQSQSQSSLLQTQQAQRQMQMIHQQNLVMQQQQWDKIRRRQSSTPRSTSMTTDKDRPLVQVKTENLSEFPADCTLNAVNKHQLQFRPQQMAMANHHAQSGHQFKQIPSLQVPQLQQQGSFNLRTPPVKVEGFQELMGGDASLKLESEEHRLTSPSK